MTPERFRAIVDAYGADSRRWPADERHAATEWAAQHRDEADALCAQAAELDAWMSSDVVPSPDADLQRRIVASAPKPKMPRAQVWWSGVAFAGVGAIGGLAGALAVSFFVLSGTPSPAPDASYLTSSFGGSTADWSGATNE